MENVDDKLTAPESVLKFFSKCGKKGGAAKSEKKTLSCRKNGVAPCAPGKKRGPPFKKKPVQDETGTL